MFLVTNILLVVMMIATLIGTMFPLISRIFTQQQITPQQSFYNRTVAPMGLLLVAMMAVGRSWATAQPLVFGCCETHSCRPSSASR
jgi:cytochrome c biogenesis factor